MHRTLEASAARMRSQLLNKAVSPHLFCETLSGLPEEVRDAWLNAVLEIDHVYEDEPRLPRDSVPYLPCPVSTVLHAMEQARVTSEDVVVDVGAGIGRALFLAHLFTGASCIGIELQSSLTQLAVERAARFHLDQTQFIQGDAAKSIPCMTTGTVFFLYCPFGGEQLERFLDGLASIAQARPIRVCCVDMAILKRPWLIPLESPAPELDLYRTQHVNV